MVLRPCVACLVVVGLAAGAVLLLLMSVVATRIVLTGWFCGSVDCCAQRAAFDDS